MTAGNGALPVIDAHCHVASTEFTPRSFVDGAIDNLCAAADALGLPNNEVAVRDRYLAMLQDHSCDELVREMDAAGVTRTALLLPDFTYALKDCSLTIAEMFQRHALIRRRHPGRFEVLAGVDPRWGKDGVALFEYGVRELGFAGLKLYPPCGYFPHAPELTPYYEICRDHGLPVLIHMGPTSSALRFEFARPEFVAAAAYAFPSVRFVLAHAATAFTQECADLCAFRPNVFLDVSGFQSAETWDPELASLRFLLRRGIAHKVLFGTDWPVFRASGTQAEFTRRFMQVATEELGPMQIRLVAHDNARRLLSRPSTQGAPA